MEVNKKIKSDRMKKCRKNKIIQIRWIYYIYIYWEKTELERIDRERKFQKFLLCLIK